ncbi:MAG TPA: hypothetical protein VMW66_01160, partial [Elusimicrobiales bacterium]|nr:hypothetical protein [Elusimicrobiales bacterium]
MTIDINSNISKEQIEQALPLVKKLFSDEWLKQQFPLQPVSLGTITPELNKGTRNQGISLIKYGKLKNVKRHSLADSIFCAEQAVANGVAPKNSIVQLNRILTLADIAKHMNSIPNIDCKLPLLQTEKWHSTLYELITAISYKNSSPEMIKEKKIKTPDILLKTEPNMHVECKIRGACSREVESFNKIWRRLVLGDLVHFFYRKPISSKIYIEVSDDDYATLKEIGVVIKDMIGNKRVKVDNLKYSIKIEYLKTSFEYFSKHDMSMFHNPIDLSEYRKWHFVYPDFKVRTFDEHNGLMKAIRYSNIICVKNLKL